MIYISPSVVLAQDAGTDGRNPRLYYNSIVESSTVWADQEADGFPIVNIANPSTFLVWQGLNLLEQHIGVNLVMALEADYFALAKHNLGSTGAHIILEGSADGVTWEPVSDDLYPPDDTTLILEFDLAFQQWYRLKITPGSAAPIIGVWYLGRKLVLPRRLYVGHSPLTLNRSTTVSSGLSESGQFLGRSLRRQWLTSAVQMKNIDPVWYRSYGRAFADAAKTQPFFFAWRPEDFPLETGYCWLTDDMQVSNAMANGMMQFSFKMQGIE